MMLFSHCRNFPGRSFNIYAEENGQTITLFTEEKLDTIWRFIEYVLDDFCK